MIFRSGPGQITCAESGRVTSVRHESRPGLNYLVGAELGPLQVDGQVLDPVEPEVMADVDEVEFSFTYPGRLKVVVRHTFAAGWGVRAAFSNLAATRSVISRAALSLEPRDGCVAWSLAMGVSGAYSISPADGAGPLLGGLLRLGSIERASPNGLELGRIDLDPGARYVLQLQWDWYATPEAFGRDRHPEVPRSTYLIEGDYVQLAVDEDVAVDRRDRFQIVMSSTPSRPSNATDKCGFTWLSWGPEPKHIAIMRNMLPAKRFKHSVQSAKLDHEEEAMGAYYPRVRYLATAEAFEQKYGC